MSDFTCPSCNGQLRYDPDSKANTCEFCGNSFPIEGTTEANEDIATCTKCGANLQFDPETQATICPGCGHRTEAPAKEISIKPNTIVPFTVSKQKFQEAMLDWLASSPNSPSDIFDEIGFESVEAVYLPFKHIVLHVTGNWNASVGYDEEKKKLVSYSNGKAEYKTVKETRWEPFASTIDRDFHFLLPASDHLSRYELPDNFENGNFNPLWFYDGSPYPTACAYDARYTAGFSAIPFASDPEPDLEVVRSKTESAIRGMAPGQHIKGLHWNAHSEQTSVEYAYLPFWLSIYTYQVNRQVFMLDGSDSSRASGTYALNPNEHKTKMAKVKRQFIVPKLTGFALVANIIAFFVCFVKGYDWYIDYTAGLFWGIEIPLLLICLISLAIGFSRKKMILESIVQKLQEKRQKISNLDRFFAREPGAVHLDVSEHVQSDTADKPEIVRMRKGIKGFFWNVGYMKQLDKASVRKVNLQIFLATMVTMILLILIPVIVVFISESSSNREPAQSVTATATVTTSSGAIETTVEFPVLPNLFDVTVNANPSQQVPSSVTVPLSVQSQTTQPTTTIATTKAPQSTAPANPYEKYMGTWRGSNDGLSYVLNITQITDSSATGNLSVSSGQASAKISFSGSVSSGGLEYMFNDDGLGNNGCLYLTFDGNAVIVAITEYGFNPDAPFHYSSMGTALAK